MSEPTPSASDRELLEIERIAPLAAKLLQGLIGENADLRAKLSAANERAEKEKAEHTETAKELYDTTAALESAQQELLEHATAASGTVDELTNAFLRWPLPESVCVDGCATKQGGKGRVGTNLLSFSEAKQMFTEIVSPYLHAPTAPAVAPQPAPCATIAPQPNQANPAASAGSSWKAEADSRRLDWFTNERNHVRPPLVGIVVKKNYDRNSTEWVNGDDDPRKCIDAAMTAQGASCPHGVSKADDCTQCTPYKEPAPPTPPPPVVADGRETREHMRQVLDFAYGSEKAHGYALDKLMEIARHAPDAGGKVGEANLWKETCTAYATEVAQLRKDLLEAKAVALDLIDELNAKLRAQATPHPDAAAPVGSEAGAGVDEEAKMKAWFNGTYSPDHNALDGFKEGWDAALRHARGGKL